MEVIKIYWVTGLWWMGWCLVTQLCLTLCNHMDCSPPGSTGDSAGNNTGVGSLCLLQGIFPTLGSNPGLLHCRKILYQLSHQGSPRILERVAYPFSSRSFWLRNQVRVSCIAGRFFTNWGYEGSLRTEGKYEGRVLWWIVNE